MLLFLYVSQLNSSHSVIRFFLFKKLISFFLCTQNKGSNIGSNSISKILNDCRTLHVAWGNLATILLHIFSTKFVTWISSDSFKIMLSFLNLPFRSSLSCGMTLSSFATSWVFVLHLLMAGQKLVMIYLFQQTTWCRARCLVILHFFQSINKGPCILRKQHQHQHVN